MSVMLWVRLICPDGWLITLGETMEKKMTVNELADYLFDITDMENSPYYQAATMLIQQQAEIENLKRLTKEPTKLLVVDDLLRQAGYVKAKTLTDEEIEEVWIQALQDEPKVNAHKFPSLANQPFVFFARAILKKLQEK